MPDLFSKATPETVCLQGLGDLLSHIRKLFPNVTNSFTHLPADLASVPNQLTTLLTSADSGIKLPATMVRDMVRTIQTTLSDHQIHEAHDIPQRGPGRG